MKLKDWGDFYGGRNRRKAEDWGCDHCERDSISPDSSMMTDLDRLEKDRRYDFKTGEFTEDTESSVDFARRNMGNPKRGTRYKQRKEE